MQFTSKMPNKQQKCFCLLVSLFVVCLAFPFSDGLATTSSSFNRYEKYFHLDETDYEPWGEGNETRMLELSVMNDAIIQIYCHLYANSTTNIILLIDEGAKPYNQSAWNNTHIEVGISQEINVTVTNGVVRHPPEDYAYPFMLFIQRPNYTDEVWGHYIVTCIDSGWTPVPWPLLPGVLGLFFLMGIKRYRKVVK